MEGWKGVWRLLYHMLMSAASTHNRKGTNSQVVRMTQPAELRPPAPLATLVLAPLVHEHRCYGNKDGGSGGMGLLKSRGSYLPGLLIHLMPSYLEQTNTDPAVWDRTLLHKDPATWWQVSHIKPDAPPWQGRGITLTTTNMHPRWVCLLPSEKTLPPKVQTVRSACGGLPHNITPDKQTRHSEVGPFISRPCRIHSHSQQRNNS